MSPQRVRTPLQTEVDKIDCELYKLNCRVDHLVEEHKRHQNNSHWLKSALNHMCQARVGLRQLMHNDDREATK